jgi:dihydrofolate reductase
MKAVIAVDENMGIGKDGKIPWNFKEDMKFFKFLTIGSTVVMGRKTFEDCGILSNRRNIVISKILTNDKCEFDVYKDIEHCYYDEIDSFIIGGSQLIESAFERSMVSELFLSRIKGDYDCDTFVDLPFDKMLNVSELKLSENVVVEKWIL